VEYKVLGPFDVVDSGRSLDLGAPGQRAALAFLLLHANDVVSADRLAEALWPERLPKSAGKTVQVYVSRLRSALGSARDRLETRGSGYRLNVLPGEFDLHEFEALLGRAGQEQPAQRVSTLQAALALWRGSPLADFGLDSFAQAEIARLEELRRLAREEWLSARLDLGAGADVVPELQVLVAEAPLQERPRALLMRALYRAGRHPEALEVFRQGRVLLDEELGLEPGPELRELERAILRQDPALGTTGPEAVVVVGGGGGGTVVAVAERATAVEMLGALAAVLAAGDRPRDVVMARIVTGDEVAPATSQLDTVRQELLAVGTSVRVAAFTSASPAADVVRLAEQQAADILLLGLDGDPLASAFAPVFEAATCDVAALVEAGGAPADGPVVVPFGAHEHDWAALELAAWVARAASRPLRLIGAADGAGGGRDASRLLADASLIVQHVSGVLAEPLLGPPGRETIAALAEGAGLLVVGLSDRWRTEGLGETRLALVEAPVAPTALVRRGLRPGGIAPRNALTRFTWSIASSGA
jgi:DNA-binding SARP family transcriptional activator